MSDVKNVFERKRTFFTAERGSVVELDTIWNGNCKVGGHVRSSKSMAAATLLSGKRDMDQLKFKRARYRVRARKYMLLMRF